MCPALLHSSVRLQVTSSLCGLLTLNLPKSYPPYGAFHMATILCIDDQADHLAIRRLLLETKGYTVLTATDGHTGIALWRFERLAFKSYIVASWSVCQKSSLFAMTLCTGGYSR